MEIVERFDHLHTLASNAMPIEPNELNTVLTGIENDIDKTIMVNRDIDNRLLVIMKRFPMSAWSQRIRKLVGKICTRRSELRDIANAPTQPLDGTSDLPTGPASTSNAQNTTDMTDRLRLFRKMILAVEKGYIKTTEHATRAIKHISNLQQLFHEKDQCDEALLQRATESLRILNQLVHPVAPTPTEPESSQSVPATSSDQQQANTDQTGEISVRRAERTLRQVLKEVKTDLVDGGITASNGFHRILRVYKTLSSVKSRCDPALIEQVHDTLESLHKQFQQDTKAKRPREEENDPQQDTTDSNDKHLTEPIPAAENAKPKRPVKRQKQLDDIKPCIADNKELVHIVLPEIIERTPPPVVAPVVPVALDATADANPHNVAKNCQLPLEAYMEAWKKEEKQRLLDAKRAVQPLQEQYEQTRLNILDKSTSQPMNYDSAFYASIWNNVHSLADRLVDYSIDRSKQLNALPVIPRATIESYMRGWNSANTIERQCIQSERCQFSAICRNVRHSKNPCGAIPGVAFPLNSFTQSNVKQNGGNTSSSNSNNDADDLQGLCIICIFALVQKLALEARRTDLPQSVTINPFCVIADQPGEYSHEYMLASHDDCPENNSMFTGIFGRFPVFCHANFTEKRINGEPVKNGVWLQHTIPYF